ncbi:MAG: type III pantothenate kinase [Balneolaceae bacterium]
MIYIDIGNTTFKAVKRTNVDWVDLFSTGIENLEEIQSWISSIHSDENMIAASVRKDMNALLDELGEKVRWIKNSDLSNFEMNYDTPKTLGMDRFLGCLGASTKTQNDVIVIDAGSACTIDMMTKAQVYLGGVIMPGLELYHRTVETHLPELPNVDRFLPNQFPGHSTKESLQWGINGAFVGSVDYFLRRFVTVESQPDIFVTGGDAETLKSFLQDSYDLKTRKYLVFDGMEEMQRFLD